MTTALGLLVALLLLAGAVAVPIRMPGRGGLAVAAVLVLVSWLALVLSRPL